MSLLLKSGQPIQTNGNNLVGLWRPSFVKVNYRLFVYGGGGNVTNDLHVLNLYDMRWETIQNVKGTPPCKRYGHTATLWNNNYIIVFGGCNEFQEYCNDVYIFDIEKLTWFQPDIQQKNTTVPARYLHSASVYDNKLFIYGGFAKNSDCTYVLDELSVLDLNSFSWTKYHGVPPRYNHSATLIGHKMYIYAGKDEHGNTVSDLFVVNLNTPSFYTPHLMLSSACSVNNQHMVLLKSQHFCEAICGDKLLVFGRYLSSNSNTESHYGLWMLNLDTLIWTKQECSNTNFDVGGWNYFTIITEQIGQEQQIQLNNLFFLGNTDPFRPQGYDHFRDALVINAESIGLYDIPPSQLQITNEFSKLLNNPELSDFIIIPDNSEKQQVFHVHQVILVTRWPHFRNIYKSGMMESRQRKMEIPEPYPIVLAFLKYLYNDQLDENESCQTICEVLVLANMYLLHRLKKICCLRLYKHHLAIDTCGLIFEKAILAEEVGLKMLCLDFMFKNYGHVLKNNVLVEMSTHARNEFLEAVPDDATLDVHSSNQYYYYSTTASLSARKNSSDNQSGGMIKFMGGANGVANQHVITKNTYQFDSSRNGSSSSGSSSSSSSSTSTATAINTGASSSASSQTTMV